MSLVPPPIPTRLGATPVVEPDDAPVTGAFVEREGRRWYEIVHVDRMQPFFMTLVSASDHWGFLSSNLGLTAGRVDADHALLPYETEDRLVHGVAQAGPRTVLRVHDGAGAVLWEPFSDAVPRVRRLERRLLKSVEGDALAFVEADHDLGLTFTQTFRFGDRVGLVRTVELRDDAGRARDVDVLDGYQNVLPHGATQSLQTRMSVLLDAYKRSELDPATGLGLFSLSSTLTDRAEPSEALRANVVWSVDFPGDAVLLSPDARVEAFRRGRAPGGDVDVRGRRAAFLRLGRLRLEAGERRRWALVADVSLDAKGVGRVRTWARDLSPGDRMRLIEEDCARNTAALRHIVARADGLSLGADERTTAHHFANTLFNVMRGGVFVDGHRVEARDFASFVRVRNRPSHAAHEAWLDALPASLGVDALLSRAAATGDPQLERLALEYLPLTFSRRHGDPSRPWNRFSIRLRNADGTPRTDYQGNWRDIFQNWEPLAYGHPAFARSMVAKFLNATTVDGYNPYRVTRDGIEWEVPEPEDPWSNLGYWGDHQIVYLQKLMETLEALSPGALREDWGRRLFSYADVPYRLASQDAMMRDWSDTVRFDAAAHARAMARSDAFGTDGRLVPAAGGAPGDVHLATMVEKLLGLLLAKLVNLVPGGGVWMNTQRPEWNDANNALVGKGLSVVTAAYLRRFVVFWRAQLDAVTDEVSYAVAVPLIELGREVARILNGARSALGEGFDARGRRAFMDALGAAATTYRKRVYADPACAQAPYAAAELRALLDVALTYVDRTLREARRSDGLAHSYQVLGLAAGEARVEPLGPMLEGQVAYLSSGLLGPADAVGMLRALRESELFWPAQRTYLLYPNRVLPGFLVKNRFDAGRLRGSALADALQANADDRLFVVDPYDGAAAFGGDLRNAADLAALLASLAEDARYAPHVASERAWWLDLFEEVFHHRAFTGRSGTFFAYEGLGSVYWHMVSKLLLAVQECFWRAVDGGEDRAVCAALAEAYFDVREGLGFRKTPETYGAFPTDPYSHTPETGGARQPGMTGQVKEELLTRMGELGVRVRGGTLSFEPRLLPAGELLAQAASFHYVDVDGAERVVGVPAGGLAFTYAQTPVVYETSAPEDAGITVAWRDGREERLPGAALPGAVARHVLARTGAVRALVVSLPPRP